MVRSLADRTFQLRYVDLGPVGAWGYPIHRNAAKESEYSKAIIGATPVPDVVLVDGHYLWFF